METPVRPRKKRRLVKMFPPDDYDEEVPEALFSNARNLKMKAECCYLPKENYLKPLGEDAHFICDKQQAIGVADGVGGWAKKGIDSGNYARELMDNAASVIQDQGPKVAVDPKQVLSEAFLNTEAEGASTACIITLKGNLLRAVNLGDSGFVVIREGKIVYRSPVQQSYFNCPYQMGNTIGYFPELTQEIVVEVEPLDVLVAATDGLFDNLFPEQIETVVNSCLREGHPPEETACTLATFARELSDMDCNFSPYTEAALAVGRDRDIYMGGKYDDVTVIVGYIY